MIEDLDQKIESLSKRRKSVVIFCPVLIILNMIPLALIWDKMAEFNVILFKHNMDVCTPEIHKLLNIYFIMSTLMVVLLGLSLFLFGVLAGEIAKSKDRFMVVDLLKEIRELRKAKNEQNSAEDK